MYDLIVDYTPNSFNKSLSSDTRYNLQNPLGNYDNNAVAIDTQSMNDLDAQDIMERQIYREKSKPGNLLNDPILNRAFANDPSVQNWIVSNPTMFPPDKKLIDLDSTNPINQNNEYDWINDMIRWCYSGKIIFTKYGLPKL
jgi:hypothetical protein